MPDQTRGEPLLDLGRYTLYQEIASGGMATVYLGRMQSAAGFARTVAIKRMHPQMAKDPDFVNMFIDEGRLAARISAPNVVQTLDVVQADGELLLVMEYVQGESLSKLVRTAHQRHVDLPLPIVGAIVGGLLHGLHAAHEATTESGQPLGIVHRDVSPQNVIVGADGVARVLDFGVAKATSRLASTMQGEIRGKLAYMAPEQLSSAPVDRRADVYAAGVVLWETLTAQRLIEGEQVAVMARVMNGGFAPPSSVRLGLSPAIDAIVMRALAKDPNHRYATARDMAVALEASTGAASAFAVSEWVQHLASTVLAERQARVRDMESIASMRVSSLSENSRMALSAATKPPEPAPPPSSAKGVVFAALIAAAMFLAACVALFFTFHSRPPEAPPVTAAPAVSIATPVLSVAAPPVVSPPIAVAPPSASVIAEPPPSVAATTTAKKTSGAAAAAAGGKKKPNCDSPFYVDASGIKQVKPECM